MNKLILSSLLALGLTSGLFADNIVISPLLGGAATGSIFQNLDSLTLGNVGPQSVGAGANKVDLTFSATARVVQGNVNNEYAPPFLSGNNGDGFGSPNQADGADMTKYLSTGIGSISLSFASDMKYFGMLWGSVDDFNSISFLNNGVSVSSFTGVNVTALANGDQGAQGTFYVNFNDLDGVFDQVILSSTTNSFEVDNIAFSTRSQNVPDSTSTVALLGLGLVGLAAVRRKL